MICSVIVAGHILACLYFTFFPKGPLAQTPVGMFYKVRVMIGPFFTSNRLKVSPHLLVKYKTSEGTWSSVQDVGAAKLQAYQHAPWKFNELTKADFVRNITRNLHKVQHQDNVQRSDEFVTLNSFLVHEVLPAVKPDSVALIYVLNYYHPADNTIAADTAWSIFYNPDEKRVR